MEIKTIIFLPLRFNSNPILASIALYSLLIDILPILGEPTKI
jgi:hypothetical protein